MDGQIDIHIDIYLYIDIYIHTHTVCVEECMKGIRIAQNLPPIDRCCCARFSNPSFVAGILVLAFWDSTPAFIVK